MVERLLCAADTMEDALLLGSIRLAFVEKQPRKQEFMRLMRNAVADFMRDATGHEVTWGDPERAPERERSGRA